jgi:hypothetical protein
MKFTLVYRLGIASWLSHKTSEENLNRELVKIQNEGTRVHAVTPVFNFLGIIIAYTLLLETDASA